MNDDSTPIENRVERALAHGPNAFLFKRHLLAACESLDEGLTTTDVLRQLLLAVAYLPKE